MNDVFMGILGEWSGPLVQAVCPTPLRVLSAGKQAGTYATGARCNRRDVTGATVSGW